VFVVDFAKADVGRIGDERQGPEEYAQPVDLVGTLAGLGGTLVGLGDKEIDFADLEGRELDLVDLVGTRDDLIGAFVVDRLWNETRADTDHLEGMGADFSDNR